MAAEGAHPPTAAGGSSEPEAAEPSVTAEDAAEMEAIQAINSRATYLGRCRHIPRLNSFCCKLSSSFYQ